MVDNNTDSGLFNDDSASSGAPSHTPPPGNQSQQYQPQFQPQPNQNPYVQFNPQAPNSPAPNPYNQQYSNQEQYSSAQYVPSGQPMTNAQPGPQNPYVQPGQYTGAQSGPQNPYIPQSPNQQQYMQSPSGQYNPYAQQYTNQTPYGQPQVQSQPQSTPTWRRGVYTRRSFHLNSGQSQSTTNSVNPTNPTSKGNAVAALFKSKAKIIIPVLVVLALVLGGAGIYLAHRNTAVGSSNSAIYPSSMQTGQYDLQTPQLNLDWWEQFTVPAGEYYNKESLIASEDQPYVAQVFVDPALTVAYPVRVSAAYHDDGMATVQADTGYEITSLDYDDEQTTYPFNKDYDKWKSSGTDDKASLYAANRWYGFGGYYLVQYIGDDGSVLDKPKVTFFTVQDDATGLDAPTNINLTVDDNGTPTLSWSAVDGANSYDVYMWKEDPRGSDSLFGSELHRVGVYGNDERSVDLSTFDDDDYSFSWYQNSIFRNGVVLTNTADEVEGARIDQENGLYNSDEETADYIPNQDNMANVLFLVRAKDVSVEENDGTPSAKTSTYAYQSVNSFLNTIPVEQTMYTSRIKGEEPSPDDDAYYTYHAFDYVNMADGTIAQALRMYDWDTVHTSQHITGEEDDYGNYFNLTSRDAWAVDYTIMGTTITDRAYFTKSDSIQSIDELKTKMEAAQKSLLQANPGYGMPQTVAAPDFDQNAFLTEYGISTDMPQLDGINVVGSTDLVKYIAANLIAGNRNIDVTKYVSSDNYFDEVTTAFSEATYQNPLTFASFRVYPHITADDNAIILSADYQNTESSDKESYLKNRDAVLQVANSWVEESKSHASTQTEQAQYLLNKLIKNAEYDYDVFDPNRSDDENDVNTILNENGETYSALLLKSADEQNPVKTVCSGYAQAYQLLMNQAGIDSIFATGNVTKSVGISSNTAHAWNVVDLDGSWNLVDATWEDNDTVAEGKYFAVPLSDVSDRTYSDTAISLSLLPSNIDSKYLTY